jgi:UbiA prenyltransferase family
VVPDELLAMMDDVATAKISHEGSALWPVTRPSSPPPEENEMTATQLRYRRHLKRTRSTLAIAEFFREYPQFTDCEFALTGRSVTIFAKEPNADLANICDIAGFDLDVDGPDPAPRCLNLHRGRSDTTPCREHHAIDREMAAKREAHGWRSATVALRGIGHEDHSDSLSLLQSPSGSRLAARLPDFVMLTKPRVMALAVFTALVGTIIAPGHLDPLLGSIAVLAIAAGAGAAGVLNMWCDADIDAVMTRTAMRPIPRGKVSRGEALAFGLVLACSAVAVLALASNVRAAALLAFAIFFYVVVYTMWLKRRTPQNIVIGGVAGALPPVIGWAAATGEIGLEPLILFLIVFLGRRPTSGRFRSIALTTMSAQACRCCRQWPEEPQRRARFSSIALYWFYPGRDWPVWRLVLAANFAS